jgi:hypothetical protein
MFLATAFFMPLTALAQVMPMSEPRLSQDERLTKAVQDQQITLTDASRASIVEKCQSSQNILVNLQSKTDKLVQLRLETYTNFQKELQAIKLRMARQGVDASEIDLLIGKLQQNMDTFTLVSDAYGTTLDDAETVNCTQKPEQFKVALVLMRVQRTKLLDSANALKKTMQDASTTTFNQLKKRLTV